MSALLLHLLKGDPDRLRPPRVRDRLDRRKGTPRIRCPACGFEPKKEDLWTCVCLRSWHTFDTGGVCPSCDHCWTETQCPRCQVWSRHQDWYADDGDDKPLH